MKIDFGKQTCLLPMPVLMIGTYNEDGSVDVMNAAWGGIHDTNQIGICIDHSHKTAENILRNKEFTVSFADEAHVAECDYLGIVSGNKVTDKFQKSGLTAVKSNSINAPVIKELPVVLECRLVKYTEDSDYLVADIINVSAEESVLTEGKIDILKVKPVIFDSVLHRYVAMGKVAGQAFSDGKKFM